MANDYIRLSINIVGQGDKSAISLKKNEDDRDQSLANFDTSDDDAEVSNIRVELNVAKVFHKVLNLIKADPVLFQAEDFQLLGEMLSRMLFGKSNNFYDARNAVMKAIENDISKENLSGSKGCRIFLEFDQNSRVAMLPWEYTLYKTRAAKNQQSWYISANIKSRFHLMRRVATNPTPQPSADKLFMIVLVNTEGNENSIPKIDSRMLDYPKLKQTFEKLKTLQRENATVYPYPLIVEYIESADAKKMGEEIERIYNKWKKQYNQEPQYVLHYIGHAMMKSEIGKLVMRSEESGNMDWIGDEEFALNFGVDVLNITQPSIVCFQACDSAKLGSSGNELHGVAYEFTKLKIPAVIGMQNEIDIPTSCAFFEKFYQNILLSKDVAEAVTAGRDYLGREMYKPKTYVNNSFGSPVLFITTEEPIRLMKQVPSSEQDEKAIQEKSGAHQVVKPSDVTSDGRVRAEKVSEIQTVQTAIEVDMSNTPVRTSQNQSSSEENIASSELRIDRKDSSIASN